jgi:hypothetical protein
MEVDPESDDKGEGEGEGEGADQEGRPGRTKGSADREKEKDTNIDDQLRKIQGMARRTAIRHSSRGGARARDAIIATGLIFWILMARLLAGLMKDRREEKRKTAEQNAPLLRRL